MSRSASGTYRDHVTIKALFLVNKSYHRESRSVTIRLDEIVGGDVGKDVGGASAGDT